MVGTGEMKRMRRTISLVVGTIALATAHPAFPQPRLPAARELRTESLGSRASDEFNSFQPALHEPVFRESNDPRSSPQRVELAEWLDRGSPSTEMTGPDASAGMSETSGFDPAVVAAGRAVFDDACTLCHDAERALNKKKDLAGWLATVRRMARKEGAEVYSADMVPIATYLASLNPAASSAIDRTETPDQEFDLFATVSLLHRSGETLVLENPGFFPEIWAGAEWRTDTPLSARVQACVSCHSETAGGGSRIELAEGFFRFDVRRWLDRCERDHAVELTVDVGRFIVPYGGFASRSHPGAYRTATRPLMYNMGQNVFRTEVGPPILPMPYADEGLRVASHADLCCDLTATADFYVINGLQGSTSLNFFQSRDYVDNNAQPAVGGRLTVGNRFLRGGASIMSGQYNPDGSFGLPAEGLDYKIYGADLTARIKDLIRFHVEYARRTNDLFSFSSGLGREDLRGLLLEGEVQVCRHPRISAVVRYDEQRRISNLPIPGSSLAQATFNVNRFTWGLNFALAGSTLMINHERWNVPSPLEDVDVLAIRWIAAF